MEQFACVAWAWVDGAALQQRTCGNHSKSGPASLVFLIPQHAESLFNTYIQFLINRLASNLAFREFVGCTLNIGPASHILLTRQSWRRRGNRTGGWPQFSISSQQQIAHLHAGMRLFRWINGWTTD